MKKFNIETGVGIFMIIGLLSLAYLSVRLGDVKMFGSEQYRIKARFASVTGLKPGAAVEIAGVAVGKVDQISLDNYEALVVMMIDPEVKLQEDAIASIRTAGIIGDKYIKITTGGADEYIAHDGEIIDTESALELEELISKYIFDKE
ncbi:MAG: outer membrane lipid asymmetry maintenance protein MlaD [Nitrospira sp.]|nr:outer membrane lipid asymmetry maintenance protein MlaD [bacterium]MBL7048866.1 outer membrane lipid asymmetry maintenance protein MlaD [Nitrospira sp.]